MIEVEVDKMLANVADYDWRLALYMPPSIDGWSLSTKAILEDPDNIESDDIDSLPESVKAVGYKYVVEVQDVKDVVENYRGQVAAADESDLLKALIFYVKNDSFIVVD